MLSRVCPACDLAYSFIQRLSVAGNGPLQDTIHEVHPTIDTPRWHPLVRRGARISTEGLSPLGIRRQASDCAGQGRRIARGDDKPVLARRNEIRGGSHRIGADDRQAGAQSLIHNDAPAIMERREHKNVRRTEKGWQPVNRMETGEIDATTQSRRHSFSQSLSEWPLAEQHQLQFREFIVDLGKCIDVHSDALAFDQLNASDSPPFWRSRTEWQFEKLTE